MYNDIWTELYHTGVKGQKWGKRQYQNPDGSLTPLGRQHYGRGLGNAIRQRTRIQNPSGSLTIRGEQKYGDGAGKLNYEGRDKYFHGRNLVNQGRYNTEKKKLRTNALKAAAGAAIAGTVLFGGRALADRYVTQSLGLDSMGLKNKTPIGQYVGNMVKSALRGDPTALTMTGATIGGTVMAAKSGKAALDAMQNKSDMDFHNRYRHYLDSKSKTGGRRRI